jgi:hypothetical protein
MGAAGQHETGEGVRREITGAVGRPPEPVEPRALVCIEQPDQLGRLFGRDRRRPPDRAAGLRESHAVTVRGGGDQPVRRMGRIRRP